MIKQCKLSFYCIVFVFSLSILEAKPTQVLSGGSISDGLDLSAIRIGKHERYTRIVFDIKYWEGYGAPKAGTSSDTVGHYTFSIDENHSIEAEFSGFRSSSTKKMIKLDESIIKTIEVLQGEAYGDDSSIFYRILLRQSARLKVFHLYNPARIVLDISE
ncbi:MAG: hypothetical protein COA92_08950 [Sulfurovum sp.]|nr:MAG: hypothetical protein COA92_08950 [Sulfurovum sp.]